MLLQKKVSIILSPFTFFYVKWDWFSASLAISRPILMKNKLDILIKKENDGFVIGFGLSLWKALSIIGNIMHEIEYNRYLIKNSAF